MTFHNKTRYLCMTDTGVHGEFCGSVQLLPHPAQYRFSQYITFTALQFDQYLLRSLSGLQSTIMTAMLEPHYYSVTYK